MNQKGGPLSRSGRRNKMFRLGGKGQGLSRSIDYSTIVYHRMYLKGLLPCHVKYFFFPK